MRTKFGCALFLLRKKVKFLLAAAVTFLSYFAHIIGDET